MKKLILIGLLPIVLISGCVSPSVEDVISNLGEYQGMKYTLEGCFEPHTCTMAKEECDIDNLGACCDCIQIAESCPIIDLQNVTKEKLIEVRSANETKYYVKVEGIIKQGSKMRPISMEATDLIILGLCEDYG